MTVNSGKVVFLVGNGFSQGLGFPGMKQLWEFSLKSSDSRYGHFLEEAKGRYPLSRFIKEGEAINDLELLLTAWSAFSEAYEKSSIPDANAYKSGRGHYEDYIANLCNWLHRFTQTGRKTPEFTDFKSLVSELLEMRPVTFITTNYDLVIEALLIQLRRSPVFTDEEKSNPIPVRKLHGSTSWFCSSHAVIQQNQALRKRAFFNGKTPNSFVYDFSEECLGFPTLQGMHTQWASQVRSTNVAPLSTLIPPVIGKEYNELFNTVMGYVWQDLQGVERLVIVGYSFPEADPVVREHIVNACQQYMPRKSQALFVNDSADACSRAQKYLGPLVSIRQEKWSVGLFKDELM